MTYTKLETISFRTTQSYGFSYYLLCLLANLLPIMLCFVSRDNSKSKNPSETGNWKLFKQILLDEKASSIFLFNLQSIMYLPLALFQRACLDQGNGFVAFVLGFLLFGSLQYVVYLQMVLVALVVFNQPALAVGKMCRPPCQLDEEKEITKNNQIANYNTMSVDPVASSSAIIPIQEYMEEGQLKNAKTHLEGVDSNIADEENQKRTSEKMEDVNEKKTPDEENQKIVEEKRETLANETNMRETESSTIKNLYYLGSNYKHSKLDEKIQNILKTNQLEKKVKIRQIAFEPTRSSKKLSSEHAKGADIILIDYDIPTDFPYITDQRFGEYDISDKAMEILRQSAQ